MLQSTLLAVRLKETGVCKDVYKYWSSFCHTSPESGASSKKRIIYTLLPYGTIVTNHQLLSSPLFLKASQEQVRVSASFPFPSLPIIGSSKLVGPRYAAMLEEPHPPSKYSEIALSKLNVSSNK